ncbi:MAG: polymer-forming cytoskeletal protein [Acidobacteriota bacterium]|jgi:cytoskeletal protein CcmA (bactofilin family)
MNKTVNGSVQVGGMLGEGVSVEGKLVFNHTFRIDGEFKGSILRSDRLVVGEKGVVSGDVEVNSLVVYGRIEGTLKVKGALEVHPHGRLGGEIFLASPSMTVMEGGTVEGTIQMAAAEKGKPTSKPAEPQAGPENKDPKK